MPKKKRPSAPKKRYHQSPFGGVRKRSTPKQRKRAMKKFWRS